MQELVTISQLGNAGIISDLSPIELPPNAISDGNNIRITDLGVESTGGYESLLFVANNYVPSNVGYLLNSHVGDGNDIHKWLTAGDKEVSLFESGWIDVTSAEMAALTTPINQNKWTGCTLGKLMFLNNPEHQPEYYDPTASSAKMTMLPFKGTASWSDEAKSFKVLRSHKNFLFALNLTEAGEHFPDGYRWSHPADANGYPFTWDETDLSALASREALGGATGEIVDGLSLRDSFVIYSNNGISVLDYTGDDFLFKRRELSTSVGLLAVNCVVEEQGKHYFITDGDVMLTDGTSVKSIMDGLIRDKFSSDINRDTYHSSYVVKNSVFNEIWFCIPTGESLTPDVAYLYNYKNNTWGRRDLPSGLPYSTSGIIKRFDTTYDNAVGTYDEQVRTFDARVMTPQDDTIVGVRSANAEIMVLEVSDASDVDYDSFIERVSSAIIDNRKVVTVNRVYPHILGTETVNIHVGSQESFGGPILWDGPKIFDAKKNRKVDIRSTGALQSYRYSSTGKSSWLLTGMDIEFTVRGLR